MVNPSLQKSIGNSPQDRVTPAADQAYANGQPYNTFDLSDSVPDTQRAADQLPFEFMNCVAGDRVIITSSSKIKANQLPATLMSKFNAYEDYFAVPMSCMFPINYDKMIANPTKGDDLPLQALPAFPIGLYLANLTFARQQTFDGKAMSVQLNGESFTIPSTAFATTATIKVGDALSEENAFATTVRFNYLLRSLYLLSSDSLLHRIGYGIEYSYLIPQEVYDSTNLFDAYKPNTRISLQEVIKCFYDYLYQIATQYVIGVEEAFVGFWKPTDAVASFTNFNFSAFGSWSNQVTAVDSLSQFRDIMNRCVESGYLFYFNPVGNEQLDMDVYYSNLGIFLSILQGLARKLYGLATIEPSTVEIPPVAYFNPSRLLAYHLSMAQYSTVDTVDYLFTAKLWMQNVESLLFNPSAVFGSEIQTSRPATRDTFYYNGVSTMFDIFTIGSLVPALTSSPFYVIKHLGLFANLFVPARSLRYRDYFMAARPNVTAVGNLQIAMNNNVLFASDVTKGLVAQRFLNAVNRVGNKLVDYLAGIFGVVPKNVEAEPHFIARRKITIENVDNTNTSNELGRQQTNLVSSDSVSGIDVYIDEDSVLVAVRSFDIVGANFSGINRHLMNFDRFQKFNPMFQNIGDQDIKLIELTGDLYDVSTTLPVFGYATRYAEYKEPVSLCQGGSLLYTPGWFFIRKFFQPSTFDSLDNPISGDKTIKPNLIRHNNAEFDSIMAGNTSLDPAGYFHFIISQTNSITAVRKMNFFTSILWN